MANGYRRGSIFWPLVLLAVGGLFLYHNFHPGIRPWVVIGKYWPILIILWGLSKLFAYFRYKDDPNVKLGSFITGGEVVLLIFILLVGTSISKVTQRQSWFFGPGIRIDGPDDESWLRVFTNEYDFSEEASLDVKAKPSIEINNRWGDVILDAWDQPKIKVTAKKRIYADDQEDANQFNQESKVTVVEEGGRYVVKMLPEETRRRDYGLKVELTISLPKEASVKTFNRSGDVKLANLIGDQQIEVRRGNVDVVNVQGNVRIETRTSGNSIKVENVTQHCEINGRASDLMIAKVNGNATAHGDFFGMIDFREVKGRVDYRSSRSELTAEKVEGRARFDSGNFIASRINGPLSLTTREKDISLEEVEGPIRVENRNGNIEVRYAQPPKNDIDIRNQSATIELILPKNSVFQIDGSTRSGEIESNFTSPTLTVSKDRQTNQITGGVGRGGPQIRVQTTFGSIKLIQR